MDQDYSGVSKHNPWEMVPNADLWVLVSTYPSESQGGTQQAGFIIPVVYIACCFGLESPDSKDSVAWGGWWREGAFVFIFFNDLFVVIVTAQSLLIQSWSSSISLQENGKCSPHQVDLYKYFRVGGPKKKKNLLGQKWIFRVHL